MPILIVASAIVRGLVAAWQPRELIASLTEPTGAAPRLAGWVAVIWLGALAIAWAMFQGTWLLASWTAFKPLAIGFAQPMLAVATLLVVVAASRPVARLLAWVAARLDRLLPGSGTVLTPRLVIGGAVAAAIVVAFAIWELLVLARLRTVDTSFVVAPIAAAVATVAAHAAWRGPVRARAVAGIAIGLATLAAIALAWTARPALTLAIWADEPVARFAIDHTLDVEAIRRRLPLDDLRPAPRTDAHPDIVVIVLANTRADRTPPYGGPAQMPALRELGQRGMVFDWVFAPTNITRRAVPAIVVGAAVNRVRGRPTALAWWLDPRHVTLAERLRAAGYETALFACCDDYWRTSTGWSRGFEHVAIEADGPAVARTARWWLEDRERRPGNRPLFAWVFVDEPARWPDALARTDDDRRRLYDTALAAADATIVDVLAPFSRRTTEAAPIAIVTSDHGQGLGEHGQRQTSKDLYDGQIHVPLVVAGPGVRPQHVGETASTVDLVPTVLELAGFKAPRTPALDGHSLADVITGKRLTEPNAGTAFAAMLDRDDERWMMVRGGWKLIDNGAASYELYDLKADPAERYNMFGQRPQIVGELKTLMLAKLRAANQPAFARE